MSIFGGNVENSALADDSSFIECTMEAGLEAALTMVAESEDNWYRLMKGTGIAELRYFEENGKEMPYNEAVGTGFFAKLKEFFKKLWEKIKGLFRRFFAMFDGMIKNDQDFLSKYKKQLVKVDIPEGFKYKGFKFTINGGKGKDSNITLPQNLSDLKSINFIDTDAARVFDGEVTADSVTGDAYTWVKDTADKETIQEKLRGTIMGDNKSYSAKEFQEELFAQYRDGENSKEEFDTVSIGEIITQLSSTKQERKTAEDQYKKFKKSFEEVDKKLTRAQNSIAKNATGESAETASKAIAVINFIAGLVKDFLSYGQVQNGALLTAIKNKGQQAKGVAAKLLRYVHENAEYGYGESISESAIDEVNFI